jgi:ribosomal protein S18 acetylase RimI-like enzyme
MPRVQAATMDDHADIIAVARMSKYTSGAANPHYLSEAAYGKGWVGIVRTKSGRLVGFTVVRHLIRDTYTSLYYIGTDPTYQGKGVGSSLVKWVLARSPHGRIRLICEHTNEQATEWYLRHGFTHTEDGANKAGVPYRVLEVRTGEFT